VTVAWADEYHQASSIPVAAFSTGGALDPSTWPAEWTQVAVKTYERAQRQILPEPRLESAATLEDALHTRCSQRLPTEGELAVQDLATVLGAALGLKRHPAGTTDLGRRRFPSAGARFPTECYVIALRVSGVQTGVYHYALEDHALETVRPLRGAEPVQRCFGVPWIGQGRAVLVLTSVLGRSSVKYGERAYRFALMEVGHAAQNLLLVAASLAVGAVPVGGFADASLGRLLGLPEGESAQCSVVLP
jgi:SagB-type dehydrogenase family enzyme